MEKATYFNPVTGEKREIEIEVAEVEVPIFKEPTLEERVKMLEDIIQNNEPIK